MSYKVNYSDNSKTQLIVDDNSVNSQTSVNLVGRKYSRYGEAIAENFLHLLENFANGDAPQSPIEGQLWYDNTNNNMKYYTKNNKWQSFANIFTTDIQPSTSDSRIGDIWVKPSNGKIHFYINANWTELGSNSTTIIINDSGDNTPAPPTTTVVRNGVVAKTRKDTQGNSHQTLEFVVNSKTVSIFSSDNITWIPASIGVDTEYMEGSTTALLVNQFPSIKKGINLNPSDTTKYNLHNYVVTELGSVKINVDRGDVILENNAFDSADGGAGITLKTTANPTNGSIFSVRSSGDLSRLWVGQTITSAGNNDFYAGFTGARGQEYDPAKYNIMLTANGTISAKFADGNWLATEQEARSGSINNKLMTPATTKQFIDSYSVIPSGAIMAFAMETVPNGWLKCDGTAVLRSAFPALFAAINTIYGQGNGTTTFNLPDYRGAFLRGKDDGRGLDPNRNFGSYQEDEFKSHTHRIIDTSTGSNGDMINSFDTSESLNQSGAAYVETTSTGGTETRPKNYAIVYCIKT